MVEIQVSSYSLYFEIARQNLHNATEIKEQINQRESKSIDLLSRLSGKIPDTDIYWLFPKMLEVRHFSTVSVIFSALTAEAFINHYGITKTSRNYFNYLDKLNLVDKWIIVPKVVIGNSIEPGSHSIQCLKKLVSLRNSLVHYKTRKLSIKTIYDWESLGMASLNDAQNGVMPYKSVG